MSEHDDEREYSGENHDDGPRHWQTPIQGDPRPSASSRANPPRLTKNSEDSFDELWSATAQSLEALLRARGLAAQDRADVMQEVAEFALRAHAGGRISGSFDAWCKAAARNRAIAVYRRSHRIDLTGDFEIESPGDDVEYQVERRLELDAVASVWRTLNDEQRSLLVEADPPRERAARNRHYVALHRLRKQVKLLAESAILGISVFVYSARRRASASSAAFAAVGIVATLTIGVTAMDRHTSTPPDPVRAARTDFVTTLPIPRAQTSDSGTTEDESGRRVETKLPGGHRAYVWSRPTEQADVPLLCASAPPLTDRACIAHPLRRHDGDPLVTTR